jgi:hypothetical protein
MAPVTRRIACARNCGWVRSYRDSPAWLQQKLTVPLYGEVTNERLVQLDVFNHTCAAATAASVRAYERWGDEHRRAYGS